MVDTPRAFLRDLLAQRYEDLKRKLTWRLGSAELASDALHDTWVHLDDRADRQSDVKSPGAYLMRIAMNMAFDRVQRERRYMSDDEIDALMTEFVDPTPGPAQTIEARDDIATLERLLADLPPRRRAIFIAVRVHEMSNEDVARRFGVSPRLVGLELKRAHEYCMAHMPRSE